MTPRDQQVLLQINSSVEFDGRLAQADILCTTAHVEMLCKAGLVTSQEREKLLIGLGKIAARIAEGAMPLDPRLEDVHTNVEVALQRQVGKLAGKVGAARGRNDLAVASLRIWLRDICDQISEKLTYLVEAFVEQARVHAGTVMPGMTHLQAAQPISFGHLCMAYAEMFYRDVRRFRHVREWMNESPLGACALAGTSFDIDRHFLADRLGFDRPTANSIDSVADRDFALEFLFACATTSIHMSRVVEDFVLWLTPQFGFLDLPDHLVGRSTVMPHKRNPDALELIRGKCGRMIGNLNTLQVVLKGLSMSYCRDLQEDKEALFDSADSIAISLDVMRMVAKGLTVRREAMSAAAGAGFTTSTDYADWLVKEHAVPFREAHHLMSELVALAAKDGLALWELPREARAAIDPRVGGHDWPRIEALQSMRSRDCHGATAPYRVLEAAEDIQARLAKTT